MDTIFFAPASPDGEALLATVLRSVGDGRVEVFRTVAALLDRLKAPASPESVAVLCPESEEDLAELVCMAEMLDGLRTVLVLRKEEKASVALAHKLHPRVRLRGEEAEAQLAAVMEKLSRVESPGPMDGSGTHLGRPKRRRKP